MTISSLGIGTYASGASASSRETVYAKDLNKNLFTPAKKGNPDAERLKEEVEDRRRQLEGLASQEGASPERQVERVRSLQDEVQELRGDYNKKTPFRVPEEWKENAKRLADAIQKAYPQPVGGEDEAAVGEESTAVEPKELPTLEDASPRITQEVAEDAAKTALPQEDVPTDKEDRLNDFAVDQEGDALARVRSYLEESEAQSPRVTQNLFDKTREERAIEQEEAKRNAEELRGRESSPWDEVEGKRSA